MPSLQMRPIFGHQILQRKLTRSIILEYLSRMPFTRKKATDFFDSPVQETVEKNVQDGTPSAQPSQLRRSARLESPSASVAKPPRKPVLEARPAARRSPRVASSTPVSGNKSENRSRMRNLSIGSQSADEVFVDARDELFNTPITPHVALKTDFSVVVASKSSFTDEPHMSAIEENQELSGELASAEAKNTDEENDGSNRSTPRPSTSQNTLDKIPSSQPRPRTQRSPVPLHPEHSSPALSIPTSTSLSAIPSTIDTITVLPPPKEVEKENSEEDSDDEAPQAISLSTSRSQALAAQSQLSEVTKIRAEKGREKRRQRDQFLSSQKQDRLKALEEVPNSQPSNTDFSGNTTDATPAPNQDHQAAKVAQRHANALPSAILQAASDSWLQIPEPEKPNVVERPRKRKERDDGVRILEEVNVRLAPKKGRISISKEKMIMRMGKGERKMYIGRFART